jgi:hypothetical protein
MVLNNALIFVMFKSIYFLPVNFCKNEGNVKRIADSELNIFILWGVPYTIIMIPEIWTDKQAKIS